MSWTQRYAPNRTRKLNGSSKRYLLILHRCHLYWKAPHPRRNPPQYKPWNCNPHMLWRSRSPQPRCSLSSNGESGDWLSALVENTRDQCWLSSASGLSTDGSRELSRHLVIPKHLITGHRQKKVPNISSGWSKVALALPQIRFTELSLYTTRQVSSLLSAPILPTLIKVILEGWYNVIEASNLQVLSLLNWINRKNDFVGAS